MVKVCSDAHRFGGLRRRRSSRLKATAAFMAVGIGLFLLPVLPPAAGDTVQRTFSGQRAAQPDCAVRVPVLVVGGTPAGVAAAVTAARMGVPVVETDARPYLGGDLTGPMLNMLDMDLAADGNHLAQGVFLELYHKLGMTFDVEHAKRVFLHVVRSEPLITLGLRMRPAAVFMREGSITGVEFDDLARHETRTICARRVVDATDDADVAAMAGVPYTIGREGSGIDRAMMSATLIFQVGGVDWHGVIRAITGVTTKHMVRGGVYHGNVWGYGPIMRMYRPIQPGVAIYDLNLGQQSDQSVLVNGLLVFDVDGTDPASVADGMRRARAELSPLLDFLRDMAPGFEHAYLIKAADYLYIRETRHIRGLYTLTAQDIVDGRVYWDAIGVANYPIDLHPYHPGEMNPFAPRRYPYTIPFRSLVPVGVANLLVASRSISASYEAAGSARVVPTTVEEGQAAGAAAVISLREKLSFRQFAEQPQLVRNLQSALHVQGVYFLPETLAAIGEEPGQSATQATPTAAPTQPPAPTQSQPQPPSQTQGMTPEPDRTSSGGGGGGKH